MVTPHSSPTSTLHTYSNFTTVLPQPPLSPVCICSFPPSPCPSASSPPAVCSPTCQFRFSEFHPACLSPAASAVRLQSVKCKQFSNFDPIFEKFILWIFDFDSNFDFNYNTNTHIIIEGVVHRGKTDVELLNDARIQTVKIQQHNECLIQS